LFVNSLNIDKLFNKNHCDVRVLIADIYFAHIRLFPNWLCLHWVLALAAGPVQSGLGSPKPGRWGHQYETFNTEY